MANKSVPQSWSQVLREIASPAGIALLAVLLGLVALLTQSGLIGIWTESEEYGHGLLVVATLVYLVGQRWGEFGELRNGRLSVVLLLLPWAMLIVLLGEASGINLMAYYGIWAFLATSLYALGASQLLRRLAVPLLILPLLFPLPNPFGPILTAELQLLSSRIGVWLIRAFGGTVYLEGNVLDMGGARLLVAEACAGLRYLFPLMSLGGILAYVMRAPAWMRWSVFLLTVPITVFMNSFRIAATGVLVEQGGGMHAEGFLHFFEGWVVFALAALALLGWTALLARWRYGRFDIFPLLRPAANSGQAARPGAFFEQLRQARTGLLVLSGGMLFTTALVVGVTSRDDHPPPRQALSQFPLQLGEWDAAIQKLLPEVENVAGATDYFYGDFHRGADEVVNAYIAYYETQRQGRIPHSPRVCIPGGGWQIEAQGEALIAGVDGPFRVNRLVTVLGERRVVAYYWLKQGTRVFRSEMLARFALVESSLVEKRTDGALVRLLTEVLPGETLADAESRLQSFAALFNPVIAGFVPD